MSKRACQTAALVPAVAKSKAPDLKTLAGTYGEILPCHDLLDFEAKCWINKFENTPQDECPDSFVSALAACDKDTYPNVWLLLKIGATLPVTSCQCERSASALRRLHTYVRASMTQQRLSSLALIHMHYDTQVDIDEVVDIFCKTNSRRLEMSILP